MRLVHRVIAVAALAGLGRAAPTSSAEMDALDETLGSVLQALNDMWDLRQVSKTIAKIDHEELKNSVATHCSAKNCLPVNENALDNLKGLGLDDHQAAEIMKLVLGDSNDVAQPPSISGAKAGIRPVKPNQPKPLLPVKPKPEVKPIKPNGPISIDSGSITIAKPNSPKPFIPNVVKPDKKPETKPGKKPNTLPDHLKDKYQQDQLLQVATPPKKGKADAQGSVCTNPFGCRSN